MAALEARMDALETRVNKLEEKMDYRFDMMERRLAKYFNQRQESHEEIDTKFQTILSKI